MHRLSYTFESGAQSTATTAPEEGSSIREFKNFLSSLGRKHSEFCNGCKPLIAEALNEALNAGSRPESTGHTNLQYKKENNIGSHGGEASEPTRMADTRGSSNVHCKE